jgi:hypothetical protein
MNLMQFDDISAEIPENRREAVHAKMHADKKIVVARDGKTNNYSITTYSGDKEVKKEVRSRIMVSGLVNQSMGRRRDA